MGETIAEFMARTNPCKNLEPVSISEQQPVVRAVQETQDVVDKPVPKASPLAASSRKTVRTSKGDMADEKLDIDDIEKSDMALSACPKK